MIKTPEKLSNYCIVCNEVAQRKDISAKAKGIYYYLATLPSDWSLSQQECSEHFTEGRESFSKSFNELITAGYIRKIKIKNEKQQFVKYDYQVLWTTDNRDGESRKPESRITDNRQPDNRLTESRTLHNTDNILLIEQNTNELINNQQINQASNQQSSKSFEETYKQVFEVFRNAFTGQKNGLETEFANFTKKNKNYAEILPLLLPAIEIENQYRQEALDLGVFFPVSKSMKTWINQKCWEQELQKPVQNNKTKLKEQQRELFEFEKEAKGKYDGL